MSMSFDRPDHVRIVFASLAMYVIMTRTSEYRPKEIATESFEIADEMIRIAKKEIR